MPCPPTSQLLQDSLVVVLLMALVPAMIVIMTLSPVIHTDTPYIVPGVTAAATIFTALVKDRIRHGLIRGLEAPLRRSLKKNTKEWDQLHLESLNTKWRGILGIHNMAETPRVVPIILFYLPCALLMTAIVTTFTPTTSERHVAYRPVIVGPNAPLAVRDDENGGIFPACSGISPNVTAKPKHSWPWPLSNGSVVFGSYYGKDCPPTVVLPYIPSINTVDPELYAYVDSGVAVRSSALGASASLFHGQAVQHLDTKYTGRLRRTTQCVPVMASNPVRCDAGGANLRRGDTNDELILTMDIAAANDGNDYNSDYNYNVYNRTVNLARNFTKDSGMVNFIWPDQRAYDQPGKGFFVLSAFDAVVSETIGFGRELARTIRDPDADDITEPNSTYVVTCTIDSANVFEYRRVMLEVQSSNAGNGDGGGEKDNGKEDASTGRINYNRILYGDEACTPLKESIGHIHHVAAYTVFYKLAMENFGLDGFFESVHRMAGGNRTAPYAFSDSRNGLEDALGVVSSIGVSTVVIPSEEDGGIVADAVNDAATAIIIVRQLGYGNLIVLVLVIPPLAALVIILYLLWMSFRVEHQPGGGVGADDGVYAAESLCQLASIRLVDVSDQDDASSER